jgi:hypothetical protein
MNHQMTGTQKFILAFTGLIVLGIGLSRISVAQQQQPEQPKPSGLTTLQAHRIELTDGAGKVRLVLQAEPPADAPYESLPGPSILLFRDNKQKGCEITSSAFIVWDTFVDPVLFSKIFLGLEHDPPSIPKGTASLYIREDMNHGGGGVRILFTGQNK